MGKNKRNRIQTPKPRNEALKRAMMEKGRSSATDRHRSVADYRRKPKHGSWED